MLNPFTPPSPPHDRARPVRRGGRWIVACLGTLLLLATALTGCGGSSNSSPPPGGGDGTDDDTIVHVTAGDFHALALEADGDAWAWGLNVSGALGDGTELQRAIPVRVTIPTGVRFEQVDAGSYSNLALDASGRTWTWGEIQGTDAVDRSDLEPVEVDVPAGTTFTHVSNGDGHSLALDQDGHAWGWGLNSYGQVGDGSTTDRSQPVEVDMPVGVRFTTVAAGMMQSAALDEDGAIWVWGSDSDDMFGGGADDRLETPVQVTPRSMSGLTFRAIDVDSGGVAIDENGDAWDLWWSYFNDAWSQQPFEPVPMPSNPDGPGTVAFTQVAVSSAYRLALDEDGRVWAWGWNWAGQLGDGTLQDREDQLVRVDMPEGVTITHVAAGEDSSFALDEDGNVWAWGSNHFGTLGNGTTANSATPVPVSVP